MLTSSEDEHFQGPEFAEAGSDDTMELELYH